MVCQCQYCYFNTAMMQTEIELECGLMPIVMAAQLNIGGAFC